MSASPESSFGPIRSLLWPIHAHELKKFVPMILMLFLICFNYSILRNMKDALVITASSSGAEVIPFIKVWALLPGAILLTYAFTKLASRFSQEKVFYIVIGSFLAFYALFTFVLYPARDILHPHETANILEQLLPPGFKGLITMFRFWTFTGFYVMCELWSGIVMTVMFWGFANEITRINEARRFYSTLGIASNLAAIAAGQTGVYLSQGIFNPSLPFGHDAWEQTLIELVIVIILSGLAAIGIFRWMNRNVLKDPEFDAFHASKASLRAKKKRLPLRESFKFLANSKYLLCIATIVVSYSLVINMVEVVWKDQLRVLYPSPTDYNTYMNYLTTAIGIVSTITSFFMGKMIERLGWSFTALITPVIMLITSAGFFGFMFFQNGLEGTTPIFFGLTPLAIAVFFGGAQNCLSKAAKYSVFDTTKEMTFIPLDHDVKLKGKAAIDGVGYRLGKSGGSLIHQGLLIFLATISASAPYVAAILLVVIVGWMIAVRSLGRQFSALVGEDVEEEPSAEVTPAPAT